ncbi:MAG: acyl-CoA thioesterase-1 [Gammaproteobacteria bacterium]|jgi:acyl-CoA thioesterase-1
MARIYLLLLLVVCAVRPAGAATVLVLGDSLSAGYGLALAEGWVHLLQVRVGERHSVVNASISGDTTAGGLTRIDPALRRHRPDVVLIELGGNDGLRGLPLSVIRANLEQIVQRVRKQGVLPVLVGMRIPPNMGPAYTARFHAIYADIAAEHALPFVPFLLEGVATEPGMMQDDGIHASALGQPRMLSNVWETLHPVLESLGPN